MQTKNDALDPISGEDSNQTETETKTSKKLVLHKETLRHLRSRTQIRAGMAVTHRSELNGFESC